VAPERDKVTTMKCGVFNGVFVPAFLDDPEAEHKRIMHETRIIPWADELGFKYHWAAEHHFLTEYSHLSDNPSWLGYLAGKTSYIHLGSGIFNVFPPVNAPARIAERVALLDHLSEGRFEFGAGRGSSSRELGGFGIDDISEASSCTASTTSHSATPRVGPPSCRTRRRRS
jgi:alkanesulfonate monooxygenase SsuD/methylene tetrahydromethanopterin reductase-like flavin-dependent oxidoreductase (luciferase family)